MEKKYRWLLLAGSMLLAGCANDEANVQKKVDSVMAEKENLVASLNAIQEEEAGLQQSFDESLSADKELKSFEDGSAVIFENIETRKKEMENAKEIVGKMQADHDALAGFEKDTLPLEAIGEFAKTIDEIDQLVEGYLASYEDQLNQEKEIYQSFGKEDADFETLYSGVETINETGNANLEKIRPLTDLFPRFDEQAKDLSSVLAESDAK